MPAPVTARHLSRVFKLDGKRDFNFNFHARRDIEEGGGRTQVNVQLRDFQIYLQSEKSEKKEKIEKGGPSVVDKLSSLATADHLDA